MQTKRMLAAGILGVLALAAVQAATRPPAIDAAIDVVSHNVSDRHDAICHHVADDPQRPDRKRLARLIPTLADPNALFAFGYQHANAQVLAVLTNDVDLLDAQFARGGRLDTPELQSMAMGIAAQWSGPPMIKALARQGVSPNAHDTDMETPLMAAARGNNLANVETLLGLGADPNITVGHEDSVERSALDEAVFCRNAAMVKTLLKHGARADARAQIIEKHFSTHLVEDAQRAIKAAH